MEYIDKMDALKATVASQEAEIARLKQELEEARKAHISALGEIKYQLSGPVGNLIEINDALGEAIRNQIRK